MKTYIAGIPCQVGDIEVRGSYCPAKVNADPDDCYEAEYPEVSFVVQDQRGRPAPWLERKMTDEDLARITGEILEELEEDAYD